MQLPSSLTFKKFLLLTLMGVSIYLLSCSRLLQSELEDPGKVEIQTPTLELTTNQTVTLNVSVTELSQPLSLKWQAEKGEVTPSFNSFQVLYTAPQKAGSDLIIVTVADDSETATGSIILTINPPDTTPPSMPQNLQGVPTDNGIILTWDAVTATDLAGYSIYYALHSYYNEQGQFSKVIDIDASSSYLLDNLSNNQKYVVGVAARDNAQLSNESPISDIITKTPVDLVYPARPTQFKVTTANSGLQLSWVNPTDHDFQGVIILRKDDLFSKSTTDGTVLVKKSDAYTNNVYIDETVLQGKQYFYSIYSYDDEPFYSEMPATANGIIRP